METQLHVYVVHSTTQPPGVPDYWPNLDLWESHDAVMHPVMNLCPVKKKKKKKNTQQLDQTCYKMKMIRAERRVRFKTF